MNRQLQSQTEILLVPNLGVRSNERGQSLVQLLVSIGVLGIIMMAFTQMQIHQSQETKALSEQLAALDLQRTLTQTFADYGSGSVCNSLVFGRTFSDPLVDPTNPLGDYPIEGALSLNNIPFSVSGAAGSIAVVGQPVEGSNSLRVGSIRVDLPTAPEAGGIFSANLVIAFDPASTVRRLKNISLPISIQASLSGGTYTVSGCSTGGSSGGGGTVIYAKCGWFTDGSNVLPSIDCAPVCPAGWTDLGESTVLSTQSGVLNLGYKQKACYKTTNVETLSLVKGFEAQASEIGSAGLLSPPEACPAGWGPGAGLLLNTTPTSMTTATGTPVTNGQNERICVKD